MKFKRNDIVLIEWIDIVTDSSWIDYEEAIKMNPAACRTVGYFIGETGLCVYAAASYEGNSYGDVWVIPKSVIKSIRKIKHD